MSPAVGVALMAVTLLGLSVWVVWTARHYRRNP